MDTLHLHYLREVERAGSINRASKLIPIQQQYLSKIIMKLEEEIGADIFIRSSKGVSLTSEGEKLFAVIVPFLDDMEKLKSEFKRADETLAYQGETLEIYKFPSVTADYYASFSEFITKHIKDVDVSIFEASLEEIIQTVQENPLHVGIVLHIGDAPLDVEGLRFFPMIKRFPIVFSHTDSHFAKKMETTSLKALLKETFVEYRPSAQKDILLEDLFAKVGRPKIKYAMTNLKAFYDCLKTNDCVAIGLGARGHRYDGSFRVTPIRDQVCIMQGLLVNEASLEHPLIQQFMDIFKAFYEPYLKM